MCETVVGAYAAVVPRITGRAYLTGEGSLLLQENDPFQQGYTVGDIWGKVDDE